MNRTRVKFCGMTRVEDAVFAARLGVDAVGLVFTRRSPRFVEPAQARAIAAALPPLVDVVALFMDDDAAWVREVERAVHPHWLQFHGSEDDAFCAGFDTPHVKAIAMGSEGDVGTRMAAHPSARAFVFDGHAAGTQGGRGQGFDWSRLPRDAGHPLVLAGGLHADNVASAIERVRPWAVDVSSGIESAPGVKEPAKSAAFVRAVREADEAAA
ncbi:MAG TPA: phosphoribosylanthranilate isomerase [Oleiagrimonas sp.]|nr:phosphoribosylanthranilate isomerase [Oleiagrimonas sp.]